MFLLNVFGIKSCNTKGEKANLETKCVCLCYIYLPMEVLLYVLKNSLDIAKEKAIVFFEEIQLTWKYNVILVILFYKYVWGFLQVRMYSCIPHQFVTVSPLPCS